MTIRGGALRPLEVISEDQLRENGGNYNLSGTSAVRVATFSEGEEGRLIRGGRAVAVYPVSQEELDSGRFKIQGGSAIPVIDGDDIGREGTGRLVAIPVYDERGLLGSRGAGFTGAYDGIPNLVHVYEIARRTLTSYEGDLVRLRRDSDNAEMDFGYDSNGDLDTGAINTWLGAADGYIVTVYDQKGSIDVTQSTAASQPLYVASGQNGKPVMRHSGSELLVGSGALAMSGDDNPLTCLGVSDVGNTDNSYTVGSLASSSDTSPVHLLLDYRIEVEYRVFRRDVDNVMTSATGGTTTTGAHLFAQVFTGTTVSLWLDGSALFSSEAMDVGTVTVNEVVIGAFRGSTSPAQEFVGDISSIVLCSAALSSSARESAQAAMNSYWSVY